MIAGKNIFVTRTIPDAGLDILYERAEVKLYSGNDFYQPTRTELIEGVKEADVVLSSITEKIDREIMELNPDLLGISNYAVGYDNIDIKSASELGIPVTNTPGILTDTTADLTWALLMDTARRITEADRFSRQKKFKIIACRTKIFYIREGIECSFWH